MPTSRSYRSSLIESLKDPQEAAAYIEAVFEDGSFEEVRLALATVAQAQMAGLSDATLRAHHEGIYAALSQPGQLDSSILLKVLGELGFRMSIAPRKDAA